MGGDMFGPLNGNRTNYGCVLVLYKLRRPPKELLEEEI